MPPDSGYYKVVLVGTHTPIGFWDHVGLYSDRSKHQRRINPLDGWGGPEFRLLSTWDPSSVFDDPMYIGVVVTRYGPIGEKPLGITYRKVKRAPW